MKAKLVLISRSADGKEFKLALPTKIGRGQDAKLKLVHPLVSRDHCEIYQQGETLMVRDLASLNGTFVDDQRVADEMALPSGSRLTVGSAQFHVLYGDDYNRPPAAKAVVRSDAPTKMADETVRMSPTKKSGSKAESAVESPAASAGASDDLDELWNTVQSDSKTPAPKEDTRDLEFELVPDDEPPKTVAIPAGKAASPTKPPAKPAAKTAVAAKSTAKPAAAKPVPAKAAAQPNKTARPPNPAEFADDDEIASSGKPFRATGRPAAAAPTAQGRSAPAKKSDDKVAADSNDGASGTGDDDLDNFFKAIM